MKVKAIMERITKKILSTALFMPVLSLTYIYTPAAWSQAQQNPNFLERLIGGGKSKQPYIVQNTPQMDVRSFQLEQAVHDLTNQVENLNIQILKMQNRIDVLEGRAPSNPAIAQAEQRQQKMVNHSVPANINANQPATLNEGLSQTLTQPSKAINDKIDNLGSIRFDRNGNIIETTSVENMQTSIPAGGNQNNEVPPSANAKELYQIGYQSILAGDYRAAEPIFRAFQQRYPNDSLIADASFWLGEALYGQGRYREAAQAYMDVERNHTQTPRAPENMLKLGMSMAQLNDDNTACAILAKVPQKYKQAEPAVLKRANDEQQRLNCTQ